MAKLIAICGADKCGKATQSTLLVETLRARGHTAVRVEVATKTRSITYRLIYWMLRNGLAKRHANVFQFVQFLNKFLFQLFDLPKLMAANDYVVFDRWALSALAYGPVTNVNATFNRFLYSLLKKPDITLILNGTSFKRNSVDDSYEKDTELQTTVNKMYAHLGDALEIPVIFNGGTKDETQQKIIAVLFHYGVI